MANVFIIDDHALIREGMKKIFSKYPDISVVGEADSVEGSLSRLGENDADILILDISLPGTSGLDALEDITRHHPRVKVLVLSMYPEERFALRAYKAGASGYLSKESAADEIVDAVRTIAAGGKYVSRELGEHLARFTHIGCEAASHETLSGREFQVFLLVARGKSTKEIASMLRIRMSTVSTYRSRIREKLCISTDADLVRYALRHDLIE